MTQTQTDTLTIRIRRLKELFETPPHNPWEDGPTINASGITQATSTWKRHHARQIKRLRIEVANLPAEDQSLVTRAPQAWKNHCLVMADINRKTAASKKRTGWRELGIMFPALAIALALSAGFEHVQPLPEIFNRLFVEGFVIIGWVIIWHPLELLLFEAGASTLESKTFEKLAELEVEVVAQTSSPA